MSCALRYDLEICKGTTWSKVIRWEAGPVVYRPISGITQAAPAVVTTVDPHGLPDGWMVAIMGVTEMTQINTVNLRYPIKAKVLTATTFELPIDASRYRPYGVSQNGTLRYNTPIDLAGYTARMHIRYPIDAADTLLELTTVNGLIALDNVLKTITMSLSATITAAIIWESGVYDLEMISPGGVVTRLLEGNITASPEVTR